MNKDPKKPTTTSWGGVAEWYDDMLEQNPDSYQKNVLMPNLIRIVDPKPGMAILDVACGQGYFSRAFAQNGADVVASDISAELIEKAQANPSQKNAVEYYVAPADNLSFMGDESMDVVAIILALQNIENLQGTFAEAARLLKPGGKLVFVVNHPSFRIPQRSDWGWDEKSSTQYRRLDAYMSDAKIEIDMTPGEKDSRKKKTTISFHRPLQVFFKHLNKSGLAMTRLEEWISHKKSQNGPRGAEEDRMRKEIPMFLCVEATKV
ncbi:MAG: class I SAM-dependent methyltransferase [Candidatus Pacebacteria bacterium]|nr:class I SAM-dependent methyltransferase [Candidatus Paceibacterota bacterium]